MIKKIILIIVASVIFSISSFTISEGRFLAPFGVTVDESMIDGKTWAYSQSGLVATVVMQGETMVLPMKINSRSTSSVVIDFHTTIGVQLAPPKMPKGVEITFEPNPLILSPDVDEIISMIIKVDENAYPSKYLMGIVMNWDEPDGWSGTNFSLNIGIDYGAKAISINTLAPPLKYYKLDVKAEEIPCRLDYVLIIKDSNGYPACVKPTSVEKLIERGWARS